MKGNQDETLFITYFTCCQSYQLWASTPQIEGLYVWNPGKNWWRISPDKRKNAEPSQVVWDSLLISPDSTYILKSSRFYDVGGKTIKSISKGTWSSRGEYVSLVPFGVNYSCVPNMTTDSIIEINLFEIVPVTRDTIPVKRSFVSIYSIDGKLLLNEHTSIVTLTNLSNGVYVIRAIAEDGQILQSKLIHE